jgi:hypothetical protein
MFPLFVNLVIIFVVIGSLVKQLPTPMTERLDSRLSERPSSGQRCDTQGMRVCDQTLMIVCLRASARARICMYARAWEVFHTHICACMPHVSAVDSHETRQKSSCSSSSAQISNRKLLRSSSMCRMNSSASELSTCISRYQHVLLMHRTCAARTHSVPLLFTFSDVFSRHACEVTDKQIGVNCRHARARRNAFVCNVTTHHVDLVISNEHHE